MIYSGKKVSTIVVELGEITVIPSELINWHFGL